MSSFFTYLFDVSSPPPRPKSRPSTSRPELKVDKMFESKINLKLEPEPNSYTVPITDEPSSPPFLKPLPGLNHGVFKGSFINGGHFSIVPSPQVVDSVYTPFQLRLHEMECKFDTIIQELHRLQLLMGNVLNDLVKLSRDAH